MNMTIKEKYLRAEHSIKNFFDQLNSLAFYDKEHPKSLGFEYVKEAIFPITENYFTQEVMRTFTEHIAFQISRNIKKLDKTKQKYLLREGELITIF